MKHRAEEDGIDSEKVAAIRRLERMSRALDPGATQRKQLRSKIVASSERFLRTAHTRRAFVETADQAAQLLASPISPNGIPIEKVMDILEMEVIKPGASPGSSGHLAYIPGGGLYHSALGDFLAAVTNKYSGIFFTGPGPVRMENMLIRWAADLVGYPATAGGNIASGGSIATLTAIATARDAHELKGRDYASTVVYLTTQTHHCVDKAMRIAGLGEVQLRYIEMDSGFRMKPDALESAIQADKEAGLKPWLVIGAAGTTDTGAVDPLEALGVIAKRQGCWFHVDAAYGGFFLLTDYGKKILKGIELSDSVILDPHKSLFLPYGAGMLIVRDVRFLLATHSYTANYMQDALRDPTEISPADTSPELTKHFRALRMWLPLILLGTKPFRAALDEKLLLARYFCEQIRKRGFEVGGEPDLSIVTYRWAPPGISPEGVNAINQAISDGVRSDGRVFLSSTNIDGRFTLRMVALSFRTHLRTIDLALRMLDEQVERVTQARGAS